MVYAPPRPRRRQLTAAQVEKARRLQRIAITARAHAAVVRARAAQTR